MLLSEKAFQFDYRFSIAIDGPSASGKSHLSQILAKKLKLKYVESGIFYRFFAKICLNKNILPTKDSVLKSNILDDVDLFEEKIDFIDLRDEEISIYASQIAIIPELRSKINNHLKKLVISYNRVVMEGRDIAKIVLPNADLKIFLTADIKERASRRSKQFLSEGKNLDFSDILSKLRFRDNVDTYRETDPLSKVDSSLVLDSTFLTLEALLEKILLFIQSR
ncbi:MAG: (d)CMP kinase [Rickettsia sp.]|nr:(d)CMP kinase [Rickettsia sp.]